MQRPRPHAGACVAGRTGISDWRFHPTDRAENRTMRRDFISHHLSYGALLLPGLLAGCRRAPSFDIDGSLFPAWLVCFVLGILLAVGTRWLLLRLKVVLVFPIWLPESGGPIHVFNVADFLQLRKEHHVMSAETDANSQKRIGRWVSLGIVVVAALLGVVVLHQASRHPRTDRRRPCLSELHWNSAAGRGSPGSIARSRQPVRQKGRTAV